MKHTIYAALSAEEQTIVDFLEDGRTHGPGDQVPVETLQAFWRRYTPAQLKTALRLLEEDHHQIRVHEHDGVELVERLWT